MNGERPTRVRFLVIAAATLMSVLLYLDRFCISFAETYIQQDLNLTDTQVGWMLSAFFWTYALGQVPSGWLTDRFGSRIMLTIYIATWSLFTGLTGMASVFAALLFLRLGFGFSQAGAFPSASSIVSKWVPLNQRGVSSGIISFGGRVGGFLALFVSGQLIVWLTPSDIPTTLTSRDLRDVQRLCDDLKNAESGATTVHILRQRCLAHFSAEGREIVDRGAAGIDVSDAQERLARELNAIIDSPGFFQFGDVRDISVEKEVSQLFSERTSSLTAYQASRANRLMLEAVFPKCLRSLYVAGWRPMMLIYGVMGVIVAALVWWSCRTTPAEHPLCNQAELDLINRGRLELPGDSNVQGVPLGPILCSTSLWASCLSQWFTNVGWVFLMTWAPRYLETAHQVATEQRALLVSIPPLVGWAGMLSGGAVTDIAVRRIGLRWGRTLPIALSRFVAMAAYIFCLFEPTAVLAVALFSLVAFATDFGTPSAWAFSQDVGGRYAGSVLGWGNMWGNLGAAMTPPFLIWIVGRPENWNFAFAACAGAFFLSGIFSLGINATIPILPPPAEENSVAEAANSA